VNRLNDSITELKIDTSSASLW